MSTKKTAAAVAKIATAATTNKVNATATQNAMKAAEIAAAAESAADGCKTCKEIAAKFGELVTKYGKENAVLIQTAAKKIVTDNKTATAAAATDAREFLADGAKVAAAAWRELLATDRGGARFASLVFDACGRDLSKVVARFASFVSTTESGEKVAIIKVTTTAADGSKETTYKPRDLSKVGGYLSALKLAIKNAKRDALGAKVADYQTEVDSAAVLW